MWKVGEAPSNLFGYINLGVGEINKQEQEISYFPIHQKLKGTYYKVFILVFVEKR
jgi:hypothetical protein